MLLTHFASWLCSRILRESKAAEAARTALHQLSLAVEEDAVYILVGEIVKALDGGKGQRGAAELTGAASAPSLTCKYKLALGSTPGRPAASLRVGRLFVVDAIRRLLGCGDVVRPVGAHRRAAHRDAQQSE